MSAHLNMIMRALREQIEIQPVQYIYRAAGKILPCRHRLHQPATNAQVQALLNDFAITLPDTFAHFLKQHNGAILFEDQSPDYPSDSWSIFGIEEMEERLQENEYEKGIYPIAKFGETLIFVDSEKVKSGQEDYLLEGSVYLPPDPQNDALHLNFEWFLERLIIAQGTTFWYWNDLNAKNYDRSFYKGMD